MKGIRSMPVKAKATLFALLAAAFYAVNIPLSKLLLEQVAPTMMAALLYLGAGVGLLLGERPDLSFYLALLIMIFSTVLMVRDTITAHSSD